MIQLLETNLLQKKKMILTINEIYEERKNRDNI